MSILDLGLRDGILDKAGHYSEGKSQDAAVTGVWNRQTSGCTAALEVSNQVVDNKKESGQAFLRLQTLNELVNHPGWVLSDWKRRQTSKAAEENKIPPQPQGLLVSEKSQEP